MAKHGSYKTDRPAPAYLPLVWPGRKIQTFTPDPSKKVEYPMGDGEKYDSMVTAV
jgi:hypothetical protein